MESTNEKAVPLLIKTIQKSNIKCRLYALYTLSRIGVKAKKAMPSLRELMEKRMPRISRHALLYTIGKIDPKQAQKELISTLAERDPLLREASAIALSKIGPSIIPKLKEIFQKESFKVGVLETISKMEQKSLPFLLNILKSKEKIPIKRIALYILKSMKLKDVDESIFISFLKSRDSKLKENAISILGDIKSKKAIDPLLKILPKETNNIVNHIAEALGKIGTEKAIVGLAKILERRGSNGKMKAIEALGKIGSKGVPILVLHLNDKYIPRKIIPVLGKMGPKASSAVPDLIRLINGKNTYFQKSIFETLGEIGPMAKSALPHLLKVYYASKGRLKVSILKAMIQMGGKEVDKIVSEILKKIHDPSPKIRKQYSALLCALPFNAKIFEISRKALRDKNYSVQVNAASALGVHVKKLHSYRSKIVELLEYKNDVAVSSALYILGRIGVKTKSTTSKILELLEDENCRLRLPALFSLGKVENPTPEVIAAILEKLQDSNYSVRYAAVVALGKIGKKAASCIPIIIIKLSEKKDRTFPRRESIYVLGKMGKEADIALPILISHLFRWNGAYSSIRQIQMDHSE